MGEIRFDRLDLNLLRVIQALFETGSARLAADRLCVTPSAISHSLARLRMVLQDQLFVWQGNKMVPTPFCVQFALESDRLIDGLSRLCTGRSFDPATSNRRFRIICNPYSVAVILPSVQARVNAIAPDVQLNIVTNEFTLGSEMESGRCDFALGQFLSVPAKYSTEDMFEDDFVWVVRRDHPLTKAPVTIEALLQTRQLVISLVHDDRDRDDMTLTGIVRVVRQDHAAQIAAAGAGAPIERRIAMTISDPVSALEMLSRTDLAALLPRRLLTLQAASTVQIIEPPYPSNDPFTVRLLWDRNTGDDAARQWLRSIFLEAAAEMTPLDELKRRTRAARVKAVR